MVILEIDPPCLVTLHRRPNAVSMGSSWGQPAPPYLDREGQGGVVDGNVGPGTARPRPRRRGDVGLPRAACEQGFTLAHFRAQLVLLR